MPDENVSPLRPGPVVVAMLSHRDPPFIQRLAGRLLEGENTHVLVHHDPRSEPHGLPDDNRILALPDPAPCDWGRMNFAFTMVRCVREALNWLPELSWVLLISGQDYPVKPMSEIEAELSQTDADAMLRHFKVTVRPLFGEHPWQTRCRDRYLRRLRVPGQRRSIPAIRRHPFGAGTELYIGDTWVNLGHNAARHLVHQEQQRTDLKRYFSRCSNPDEAYLSTLLLNDAQNLTFVNQRKRYIAWSEGQPHPRILNEVDLEPINQSDAFFARKMDAHRSATLLSRLDQRASDSLP